MNLFVDGANPGAYHLVDYLANEPFSAMPGLSLLLSVLPTAEETFRSLLRTLGQLERSMQPYFARFGISGAQWGVLRTLHRAEDAGEAGLRLVDLSERLLVRPPSMTGVVSRLEQAGLVARRD